MSDSEAHGVEDVQLAALYRFPVKGLRAESLQQTTLHPGQGISGDREWALSNDDLPVATDGAWTHCGAFERLAIRPEMALWHAEIAPQSRPILRGPNGEIIAFDAEGAVSKGSIELFQTPFSSSIRLRHAKDGYWDHADGAISIINLATLEEIERASGHSLDPLRFRGNLYVRAEPWSEFDWLGRQLDFGEITLDVIRPIDRCRTTSVNPDSGLSEGNVLAELMRGFGHIYCGVYAKVVRGGVLKPDVSGYVRGPIDHDILAISAKEDTAPKMTDWPRVATVHAVQDETSDTRSVVFIDPLASLEAWANYATGQYIKLHNLDGEGTWRTYTVSSVDAGLVRVTVKRDMGPGSRAVHRLNVGDTIKISGPMGGFTLPEGAEPLVFLTAGIGITPTVAMAKHLADDGSERDVNFIHVERSRLNAALWPEINEAVERMQNATAELWTTKDATGDRGGRPDLRAIAKRAVETGAIVMICGPEGFTTAAQEACFDAGLPEDKVRYEAFVSPGTDIEMRQPSQRGPFPVRFEKSGVDAVWTPSQGTLLDLAERHGIAVPNHCRAGVCGTCQTTIRSGEVNKLTGVQSRQGVVLTCCSVPVSTVVLDL